jgi:phosphoribosylformylglycinamidine synthase
VTSPRIGVITFPGSLDDRDALRAVELMGGTAVSIWHADRRLPDVEAVILPGGFSYGDYLRAGAIAARAPIMEAVRRFAGRGGPVVGFCNGFQILCEAGLLPGALVRNSSMRFVCRPVHLRIETAQSVLTAGLVPGEVIEVPVKHGEGRFIATDEQRSEIDRLGLVAFRYCDADGVTDDAATPNGSTDHIAGLRNEAGNVVGLMPHPEHAVDPDVGPTGGQPLFGALLASALAGVGA